MIKIILFLVCFLWGAEDHIIINGQTLNINPNAMYLIAGYTGTIKQHFSRSRTPLLMEMYENSLDFFRAYPNGFNGRFALAKYKEINSTKDNQVIHKYDLVYMACNDLIEQGKFSVYQHISTGILKTWVILNFTANNSAVAQTKLMELIDLYKQNLE